MMAALRFRELPAMVPGKTDCFMADPRKLVVDADYNCRDMKSAETLAHIDWLADEIENTGFNPEMPLTVRRRDDDTIIVRGHCRHAALLKLIAKGIEVKGVPVMQIAAGTSDIDLIFDQEASNYGLRLDPLARARLVLKAKRLGVSDDEIAKRMHWKSTASVKQHLEMLEILPEDVKQRVRDGKESATLAVKLQKEDPEFAEKLRRENEEQNKRLGVGVRPKKLTQKAVTRAKASAPKSEPKPPAQAKPEPEASTPLASGLPGTTETEGSPVSGVQTYAQLQDEITLLTETKPGDDAAAEQQRRDQEFEAAAPKPAPHTNKADVLIFKFMSASLTELAAMFASLNKEHDEALADDRHTVEQHRLIKIADEIGWLHFDDDWHQAKANTEMEYA